MKIAISPTEPVAVMTMTWRIVEPVTNLAVWPRFGALPDRSGLARRQAGFMSAGSATFVAMPSLSSRLASLRRLDQRLGRDRLGVPAVAAGLDAFDGLQRQPLLVAAAHILEDSLAVSSSMPSASSVFWPKAGPDSKVSRTRSRRPWLAAPAYGAIVGAHEEPGFRELALDQVDDPVGDRALVDADATILARRMPDGSSTSLRVPSPK